MTIRPLPIDLIDHLTELSGNEYMVWTYYYLRSGEGLTCYPSNKTVGEHTGLCVDTVKTCKASLRAKGWLRYTGDYRQPRHKSTGNYAVPVMEVGLPWKQDWAATVGAINMAYDTFLTVVEKTALPEANTVVENFHSGSMVRLGLDSSSLSSSSTAQGNLGLARGEGLTSKEEAKSKPENPEPQPKSKPTPLVVMDKEAKYAPDGTPWPEDFDSWRNADRLQWLGGHRLHGREQPSLAHASSLKPTPLPNPPSSAPPPFGYCGRCGESDDFCSCPPDSLENMGSQLDNWREL